MGIVTAITMLGFTRLAIDTDPENMLASNHPVRVLNAEVSETFGIGDMIDVGPSDPNGATMVTIERSNATLRLHDSIVETDGVRGQQTVSLALAAPDGVDDADAFATQLSADPLLGGNVLTDDGETAALFVALDDGDTATDVRQNIEEIVARRPHPGRTRHGH